MGVRKKIFSWLLFCSENNIHENKGRRSLIIDKANETSFVYIRPDVSKNKILLMSSHMHRKEFVITGGLIYV